MADIPSILFGFLSLGAIFGGSFNALNELTPSVVATVVAPGDDGTPIVFILGQSNAEILFYNGAVQESLSNLEIDARIVLVAAGGESVARPDGAWNVVTGDGADNPGWLYTEFLETYNDLKIETSNAYIVGAIWLQGEADAYSISPYYKSTRALFEKMYRDTGVEFPISVIGLSDYHDLPDVPKKHLQDAQMQLAQDLDHVSFIDTNEIISDNGLSEFFVMRDGLHYNSQFYPFIAEEAVNFLLATETSEVSSISFP